MGDFQHERPRRRHPSSSWLAALRFTSDDVRRLLGLSCHRGSHPALTILCPAPVATVFTNLVVTARFMKGCGWGDSSSKIKRSAASHFDEEPPICSPMCPDSRPVEFVSTVSALKARPVARCVYFVAVRLAILSCA
jgi:hypothetical protein